MPVVIGSLSVVTGLAVTTFTVSVQGNHASAHDRDSKKALAAAEAGLQMAILRVSEISPEPDECVTTAAVPSEGGECPSTGPISIGNGASYSYVVATPASGTCATVPGFIENPQMDRCITSTGVANGVRRRLQLRFYFRPPYLPWGNAGLVGKNKIDIGNNKTISSTVGTNGPIFLGNNSDIIGKALIGPEAPAPAVSNGASISQGYTVVEEWQFPPMDWDTPRSGNHNNASLAQAAPGAWDGKFLKLAQQQDITLQGGSYYMCGFDAPNGNTINVPPGQFVRLYIDSHRGNPDWCPDNDPLDGRFVIKNQGQVNPLPLTDPTATQFAMFVYGSTDDNTDNPADVDMNNGVSFWGTIWAPESTVDIKNNQTVKGGFTAGTITLKNNGGFEYDADIANQPLPGTAQADNLSWTECRRDPTDPSDPESGCS